MTQTAERYPIAYLQGVNNEMAAASGRAILHHLAQGTGGATFVKPNRSVYNNIDRDSEKAAHAVWQQYTDLPFYGEETGMNHDGVATDGVPVMALIGGRIVALHDPVDGSRPTINGAHTGTAMSGTLDLAKKRLLTASLLHPFTGELIEASNGDTWLSRMTLLPEEGYELNGRHKTEVLDVPLNGSTVYVDCFAPFAGRENTREITNRKNLPRFLGHLISEGVSPLSHGSNGYHQMLLAKGGEALGGAIMLAKGGEWDAIGLLAVENAGGFARAYSLEEGKWFQRNRLQEQDPHDLSIWDILVLTPSKANLDKLSTVVEQTYHKRKIIRL